MSASESQKTEQWTISASQRVKVDPLLDSLVLLTEYFGSPCSCDSLAAGLPMQGNVLTPELLPQAASRAGLAAKLSRKGLDEISAIMLPCILLLKDQKACLLRELDIEKDRAVIQLPETGGEETLSIEALEALYVGYLFLVKQEYRGDMGLDIHLHESKTHWLWQTIKDSAPIYRDALIASVLVNLFALVSPLFIMNVYDKVVPNLAFDSLWVLAIGAGIAYIFDLVMRQLRSYLIDVAGKKVDIIVSSKLFAKAIGIPLEKRSPSVGGMAKQLGEFDSIRDILTSATITTLVDLPFALFFLFIIYLVAGDLALIPFVGSIIIIGYTLIMQPKLKAAIDESNKFSGLKHGHLIESLASIESIKSSGAEGLVQKSWQQMIGHTANWQLKSKKITTSVTNMATFVVQTSVIFVVILGVYRVSENEISMGGIIAAVILSSRAISPMAQLAGLMTRGNQTASALKQLNELMTQEDEFENKGHLVSRQRLLGQISAHHVSFSYPDSERPILHPLSINIAPGERVAIIGRNGSGKSTLAKLLVGLYQPTKGSLTYDGLDSAQIHPSDLRRNFGYLPQDITLFHGTIRDNILFGTRQVTEHQLIRAVQLSGVNLFTNLEAEGLDQQVGEGGRALSRGQRQTISLARATLNDPPVLLMDEPTASLDARAEKQFINAMQNVSKDRTLLLITHKMHLLNLVDRIIVLDRGHIVADGPKADVLKKLNEGLLAGAAKK
ncbi:type I secretion system permease/ATPase [Shewanella fidelis]|uniref:Type I secretion system permease/ATPase n=1 Tax=Shewanella fidelis TaxID=173509 RepID=A0AAW8NTT3_9GAMM|nr:type I secretion system permease/ATPase [Shewanella fidelis]MDR8526210.1 type I secretion system permease/ATPase [Shewanella fidelis]MDW4814069.1 type I secretion system permease/ATPase [Shewanella fidelis]MDW4818216.1 type I secretion system permease/ATPase [Shewanella fidelis]MDW4822334.1 type I secretion system permease/ATPase [Shewanella fidelis]MDW4826496.1 type I secretion system permease/ATPase [Shewanella fidelis]